MKNIQVKHIVAGIVLLPILFWGVILFVIDKEQSQTPTTQVISQPLPEPVIAEQETTNTPQNTTQVRTTIEPLPPITDRVQSVDTTEPQIVEQPVSTITSVTSILDGLLVRAENRYASYNRDEHYGGWIDADNDGCNTRCEVLEQERLDGGCWYSIFDRRTSCNSSNFDIDHLIPLKEAHESGAWAWSREQRVAFANDLQLPEALIAVSFSSNRSKGSKDIAEWLPSNKNYHYEYVVAWVKVKKHYGLSVDTAEYNALRRILEIEGSTSPPTQQAPLRFSSCAEAKQAGYRDLTKQQVEMLGISTRDGDGDGVYCE